MASRRHGLELSAGDASNSTLKPSRRGTRGRRGASGRSARSVGSAGFEPRLGRPAGGVLGQGQTSPGGATPVAAAMQLEASSIQWEVLPEMLGAAEQLEAARSWRAEKPGLLGVCPGKHSSGSGRNSFSGGRGGDNFGSGSGSGNSFCSGCGRGSSEASIRRCGCRWRQAASSGMCCQKCSVQRNSFTRRYKQLRARVRGASVQRGRRPSRARNCGTEIRGRAAAARSWRAEKPGLRGGVPGNTAAQWQEQLRRRPRRRLLPSCSCRNSFCSGCGRGV